MRHKWPKRSVLKTTLFVVFSGAVSVLLPGCEKPVQPWVFTGATMGTQYQVTIEPNAANAGELLANTNKSELEQAIINALDVVNQSMSNYIADSELSQFNRLPAGQAVVLSPDMLLVMREALQISELSQGAFDVTLGKAIRLWGFAEDGRISEQPSAAVLADISESVGHRHLSLEGDRLSKDVAGLEVNLSAIAKGYAVDKVAEVIAAYGFTNYLVSIGGELRASGVKADNTPWRLGIEKPHVTGGVAEIVNLHNEAIATSGDYRNYHIIDGQHFSHTINPQTLKPVYHKLASVSVLAPKASTADALATALLSMGEEKAVSFAKRHNIAAFFIIRGEKTGDYRVYATDLFMDNLAE